MQRPNRSNFAHLIKDELVKRFEQVVSDEISNHNDHLKKHYETINNLKSDLELTKQQIDHLRDETQKLNQLSLNTIHNTKTDLEKSLSTQIEWIRKNLDFFDKKIHSFEEIADDSIDHNTYTETCKQIDLQIKKHYKLNEKSINILSELLCTSIKKIRLEITEKTEGITKQISDLQNIVSKLSKDIDIHKIDSRGVLKELLVYKKSMFIIEKKLEHIIDRLEKVES